jgi:hypothetical protein
VFRQPEVSGSGSHLDLSSPSGLDAKCGLPSSGISCSKVLSGDLAQKQRRGGIPPLSPFYQPWKHVRLKLLPYYSGHAVVVLHWVRNSVFEPTFRVIGLNATIRDRFYGAASSTPVTVFGNLMRLKNHHLAKLERAGRRVFFEKLLGQIINGVSDFPSHLRLEDQGRFAIGYYHQAQDFYSKKN